MSYLRTFLPWIIYAVVPSGQWQWGALAALIAAVGVVVQQLRAGRGADALIIELSSAVFFAGLTVIALADPKTGLHHYSPAISATFLALVAGGSLAIGKPFTLGIAKQSVPREWWDQPGFIRTNVVITAVWAGAFAVSAAALYLVAHAGNLGSGVTLTIQVAGFVVPMVFTVRYAAAAKARAVNAAR